MRVAYADPPYIGQARKHYNGTEVNHPLLIAYLNEFDAWALSCSSPSLPQLLPLCPAGIRVMVWVKPFCVFKPGVGVAYAWEPVLVHGGRKRSREQSTVRDWVSENITLKRGLPGVKPDGFSLWLFEVLNMCPSDEFVDVFPGSGAVGRAWQKWLIGQRSPQEFQLEIAV